MNLDIPYKLRFQHVFMPGMTGHGKSTLMAHWIQQDFLNGCGVTVIDPKGSLIDLLMKWIPEKRKNDVIYLDLENRIPIDFLDYEGSQEKESLVSELKFIVERGDESLTRADAILEDLLWSMLAIPDSSFLDIFHFFRHLDRRNKMLEALGKKDPELWARWNDDFPSPAKWEPIITRFNKYYRNPSLNAIFGHPHPKLNIAKCIEDRNILLVKLGGTSEARTIYGSMIIAKIQQAIFRRHDKDPDKLVPHFLYVDEFEDFQTLSFPKILSQARGFKLALVLACQYVGQLDTAIRQALFGNAKSYVIFCLGNTEDTHYFKKVLPPESEYPPDLLNLPEYKAAFKIGNTPLVVKNTPEPPPKRSTAPYAEHIQKRTVDKYGCPTTEDMVQSKKDGNSGNNTIPETVLPDQPEAGRSHKPGKV